MTSFIMKYLSPITLGLVLPLFAFGAVTITNPLAFTTFYDLIYGIYKIIFNIGILVAILMVIWSGFLLVTSGGKEEQLNRAKKALFYTLLGFALLLLGGGIIEAVCKFFVSDPAVCNF